jgi:hypothetical protein
MLIEGIFVDGVFCTLRGRRAFLMRVFLYEGIFV